MTTPPLPGISQCIGLGLIAMIGVAALLTLHCFKLRHHFSRLNDRRSHDEFPSAPQLYDSLLQDFQGVMFRLQAVRHLLPSGAAVAASMLDQALDSGDIVISNGQHATRVLHQTPLAQSALSNVLIGLGKESASILTLKPRYRVVVEGRPREIDAMAWDGLYGLTREVVCNAFRHANAANIEAELAFGQHNLSIRVRDDGVGIDRARMQDSLHRGRGWLTCMLERANSFGAELNVWSSVGAGTEIELRIPRRFAYCALLG